MNAKKPKRAAPLTNNILRQITAAAKARIITHPDEAQSVTRDMAIILIMQKASLRASEACNLMWQDISFGTLTTTDKANKSVKKEVMKIFIRKSKTDQTQEGHTALIIQADTSNTCAIDWYLDYVSPLKGYRVIGPQNTTPLFQQLNNKDPLKPDTVSKIIKKWVATIGLDESLYSSHSCRRGGTTEAARKGASIQQLMKSGNWKSKAVLAYVEPDDEDQMFVASLLASDAHK